MLLLPPCVGRWPQVMWPLLWSLRCLWHGPPYPNSSIDVTQQGRSLPRAASLSFSGHSSLLLVVCLLRAPPLPSSWPPHYYHTAFSRGPLQLLTVPAEPQSRGELQLEGRRIRYPERRGISAALAAAAAHPRRCRYAATPWRTIQPCSWHHAAQHPAYPFGLRPCAPSQTQRVVHSCRPASPRLLPAAPRGR